MNLMSAVVRKMYNDKLNPAPGFVKRLRERTNRIIKDINDYLYEHQFLSWLLKVVVTALIVFILASLLYVYNLFSKLHTSVLVSYAQIGVEIKRRDNLIPNLIIATKKYSAYEQETFKHISETKELLVQSKNMKENGKTSSQLDSALSRLLAIAEQYPDLKATQSMQDLTKELTNTEDRIAEKKLEYNKAIYRYNSLLTEFPSNLLGRLYGFWPPFEYHSTQKDELENPKILYEWNTEINAALPAQPEQVTGGSAPETAAQAIPAVSGKAGK